MTYSESSRNIWILEIRYWIIERMGLIKLIIERMGLIKMLKRIDLATG